jgi:hypothetical protein
MPPARRPADRHKTSRVVRIPLQQYQALRQLAARHQRPLIQELAQVIARGLTRKPS